MSRLLSFREVSVVFGVTWPEALGSPFQLQLSLWLVNLSEPQFLHLKMDDKPTYFTSPVLFLITQHFPLLPARGEKKGNQHLGFHVSDGQGIQHSLGECVDYK